jgi:Ca-activated chloride channel family protein
VIFAAPWFLLGTLVALLYGLVLVVAGIRAKRAQARFGDEPRMRALVTHDASTRRAFRGVFIVLATALAFVAAARPQYGGQKVLVPATKVDIVVALDFSKSMYARDVEPSRIFRAKAEVGELVQALPGVRFGAVAFAGEAMGFPLTSDGAAIAQFFRGVEPNDMPVGGTSLSRALDQARDLLKRDPKSKDHKRFVILITDGEDLDGSPLSIARSLGEDGTTIHVVQIGGRTPERIPEIGPDGEFREWRKDRSGQPMTTELSSRGEAQLESIAKATAGGRVVRAAEGRTGIEEITAELREAMKTGEYAEHYEEIFADVYEWPLGFALLLLLLESLIADAPRFRFTRASAPARGEARALPIAGRAHGG